MTGRRTTSSTSSKTAARQVVVAIAVVVALMGYPFATAALAAPDGSITDVDQNTPLTDRSTWERYQDQGNVSVDVAAPDMTLSVSKTHDEIGLDGWRNDFTNDYLRVEYHEDIKRTVRFYVPSNYVAPYFDESVESENGNAVAKFVPVDGGRYMAVTITFNGPTDAVFEIKQSKGVTWSFWSDQDRKLENTTGVSSGITGSDQWNYVEETDWSGDGTYTIENVSDPSSVTIQYDADVSSSREVWLKAPTSPDHSAPVYYSVREPANESANASILLVSEVDDPPAVRVKKKSSTSTGLFGIFDDWSMIGKRFNNIVDSLFGSGKK